MRVRLFLVAIAVQAAFGVASVAIVRWSFRSWPTGAYVIVPASITLASVLVLVSLGRYLAWRGLPFALVAAGWYLGRVAGATGSAVLTRDGFAEAFVASASFGAVALGSGRVAADVPWVAQAVLPLAVLGGAYLWGRRARAEAEEQMGLD